MKLQLLLFSGLLLFSQAVFSLPDLSEPNDIFAVGNNAIDIINTNDNSILQCDLVSDKLQGCRSKIVSGLNSPYRAVVAKIHADVAKIFVTHKQGSDIHWFPINADDKKIPENAVATKILPSPFDGVDGNILDIQSSEIGNAQEQSSLLQKFYFSKTPTNSSSEQGQFGLLTLDLSNPNTPVTHGWFNFSDVHMPAFFLSRDGENAISERIIGVGHTGGALAAGHELYPFSSTLLGSNGQFYPPDTKGGVQQTTHASIDFDVASIAQVNGSYWVTYKSQKKFTKFNDFPLGEKESENTYLAPSNANVTIRKVIANDLVNGKMESSRHYFAVFADDKKVGHCTGANDFVCTDAFRYLDMKLSINDENVASTLSFTSRSHNDHGSIVFRNLNYSSLSSHDVVNHIAIPTQLMTAFSGTCLTKIDFTARSVAQNTNNDSCTLNFDFRNLTNIQPISESFDVGFGVNGPFGEVATQFHFNIDLPTTFPHFQFQQHGKIIDQLNVHPGDSGSIDIVYLSNGDESDGPVIGYSGGIIHGYRFSSYFTPIGCSSLSSGQHCVLNYHVPVDAFPKEYGLYLDDPNGLDATVSRLVFNVSGDIDVLAHALSQTQNTANLVRLKSIQLQPGNQTSIRFTNLGVNTAHNFKVHFSQPQSPVPISLSGSCVNTTDLTASGGSCDLTITLAPNSVFGRFDLVVSADDYIGYSLPIIIGHVLANGMLTITDSHTGLTGTVSINQSDQGYLQVTNNTGYYLGNLTITLPELGLYPASAQQNNSIFYQLNDGQLPSCIEGSGRAGEYHIALAPAASCIIAYKVNENVIVTQSEPYIAFNYDNLHGTERERQWQRLRFSNRSAISVSFQRNGDDIQDVHLDASMPTTRLTITNRSDYTIQNLRLNILESDIHAFLNNADCQFKSLAADESCTITVTLDDHVAVLGDYRLRLEADNLQSRTVSLNIAAAKQDTVEVDNRGGYVMYVGYTDYFPNHKGNDGHCRFSTPCYATKGTGSYTNPFNTSVTGISGRELHMNMVWGTSVTLPSCDGGKITCTGTTLNPACRYYDDGTGNPDTPQNQCLYYNK
ncbi:MAG: hypothetical protein ACPGUD_12515 [Parashewanella sp.]